MLVAFAAGLLATASTSAAQGGTASISGTVLDGAGDPPPGVGGVLCPGETFVVFCDGFQFVNGNPATGEYTLSGLDAGTYSVVGIGSVGSATVGGGPAVTLTVGEGEAVSGIDFELDARIGGTVTDPLGDPVDGASVNIVSGDRVGIGGEATTTDANGDYLTPYLGAGEYTLRFEKGGTLVKTETVSVGPDSVATLNVQLAETAAISGTIFDGAGQPAPGLAVSCPGTELPPGAPPSCSGLELMFTNAAGEYTIGGLEPGTYTLVGGIAAGSAFVGAGGGEEVTLTLAGGEHATGVDFVFNSRIEGTVTDPSGDPLAGVSVQLGGSSATGGVVATTDSNGEYLTPYLGTGPYALSFVPPAGSGLATKTLPDITVPAGTVATHDAQLEVGTEVGGTVLGDGGAVLPSSGAAICPVPVVDFPLCQGILIAFVNENGEFQFNDIAPGSYTINGFQITSFDPLDADLTPVLMLELASGDVVTCEFTLGSSPSATCSGATGGDGDGIDAGTEDGAPNGGDGNNDGVPDSQQPNVASLPSALDVDGNSSLDDYLTLAAPAGTELIDVEAVDPADLPVAPPPGAQLPFGVVSFKVNVANPGDTTPVTLFMPAGATVDSYFKFHDGAWSEFPDVTINGNELVLTLTDGGAGDEDDTANGVIVDPGAPADVFDFEGFFRPVDNPDVLNKAKAGSAIPIKFSLGGDQGLDVFADGYPKSKDIPGCDFDVVSNVDEIETVTAGQSGLSYDPDAGQYTYVWKTDNGWPTTCRQLVVKLSDGTVHRANFTFK